MIATFTGKIELIRKLKGKGADIDYKDSTGLNPLMVACYTGVTHIRVHDLRHSHASMLINMGCNIVLVSKRLGHESVSITLDTYGHLYPTQEDDMIDKLEKIPCAAITKKYRFINK